MAKKHPIYRLHKIKLHPNRWLIWAIAYTAIAVIAMVGYIEVSDVNFETNIAENEFHPWRTYNDPESGFSIRYPSDWSIEADNDSTVTFVPLGSRDEGVSVAVMSPASEASIRAGLDNSGESRVSVDGNRAVKIINNLGGGHYEAVIMTVREGRLYIFRGTERLVEAMLWTFHFIK